MKKLVRKIRNWIIAIWIMLILSVKTFKNIILYKKNKINLHIYKGNMMNAMYQYCSGIIVHKLMDSNEAIKMYIEFCDEIRKA